MEQKEKEILLAAAEVFMRLGIKSVNMDDVSRQLGISKKTLYKYVSDKNDLVSKAVALIQEVEAETMFSIQNSKLNAIDENMQFMKEVISRLNNLHPSIMFDLEKYHPEVCRAMIDKRHSVISKCVMGNLKKGINEGLYRKNLNVEIITVIYMHSIDVILDQKDPDIDGISFSDKFKEYFRYHTRGIASEKGIEYLKEKYSKS